MESLTSSFVRARVLSITGAMIRVEATISRPRTMNKTSRTMRSIIMIIPIHTPCLDTHMLMTKDQIKKLKV